MLLAGTVPAPAQTASLHVNLHPLALGHETTLAFSIHIARSPGQLASPLARLDLGYPNDLGIAVSGLGIANCQQERLELFGSTICPAESRMGQGEAIAEIQLGTELIEESAPITILRTREHEGHLALLFSVEANDPVAAQITFTGVLLAGPTPNEEDIQIDVPLIEGLPGGPDVAVTTIRATVGPKSLTYYEHIHGKLVPYHPHGILLPRKCPHDGFQFKAHFSFLDGSHADARTRVPCPRRQRTPGPRNH
jgi:hypothetical protein